MPLGLSLQSVVCYGGALIALLFLVAMYSRYALDFPYADQWDFVPFLEKASAGQLGWRDFWAQHNEHRLVFPRLLMLALALPSHWNVYWELAANVVLALATWVALCLLARNSGRALHQGSNKPLYLIFALLVFSLSQWGNWFLGWQLQEFMNVLAAVLALAALTWKRVPGAGLLAAAGFGIIATYSFANGLLVWPIGLFLLWLQRAERGARFRLHAALWCAMAAAVLLSYFAGYESQPHHTPLLSALRQPFHCAFYVLGYLGQPAGRAADFISIVIEILGLGTGPGAQVFCILMGFLGLLFWGVTLAQLRFSGAPTRPLHFWTALALYAFGTATLTALGRVEEGVGQAISSRYVTMANLLWFAVAAQAYWAAQVVEGQLTRRALPIKLGVLCAALVLASLTGAYRWSERYHAYAALRDDLIHGQDPEKLRPLYPPAPERIIERRTVLEAHGWSVFRSGMKAD